MKNEIPVLLLTGYLGSGKTTLLNRILTNRRGIRFAVIVNDLGEVNIDAALIQKGGVVGGDDAGDLVALQNGCICCSLKMDLVEQLTDIASTGKFDYIVIEASGICEPAPIARTICMIPQMEEKYSHAPVIPRLDCITTVVDALRLRDEFDGGAALSNHRGNSDDDIESLVIQQIEFCNIILLNKISEVSAEEGARIRAIIRAIQPKARIIDCDYCDIDLDLILGTGMFNFERVATSAAWVRELEHLDDDDDDDDDDDHHHHDEHDHHHGHDHHHDHEHDHEHDHDHAAEYGITTMVYYRRQPFDINKLDRFIATGWPRNIIRTKGVVYFSHNRDMSYLFEQAGTQKQLTEAGLWFATAPAEELERLMATEPGLREDWDERYGDRMIKLVIIGRDLDTEAVTASLDGCLAF